MEKPEENGECPVERNAGRTPCRASGGPLEGVETRRGIHVGMRKTPTASGPFVAREDIVQQS